MNARTSQEQRPKGGRPLGCHRGSLALRDGSRVELSLGLQSTFEMGQRELRSLE